MGARHLNKQANRIRGRLGDTCQMHGQTTNTRLPTGWSRIRCLASFFRNKQAIRIKNILHINTGCFSKINSYQSLF